MYGLLFLVTPFSRGSGTAGTLETRNLFSIGMSGNFSGNTRPFLVDFSQLCFTASL